MPLQRRSRGALSASACLIFLLHAGGCGGDSDGGGGGGDDGGGGGDGDDSSGDGNGDDPAVLACELADAALVMSVFEGTSGEGTPGTSRNCRFEISGGQVQTVTVFHYGPADDWDGVRQGYDANRGGTTDVPGIGNAAYYPNDRGPLELVVQTNEIIFALSVFVLTPKTPPGLEDDVAELAQAIVATN